MSLIPLMLPFQASVILERAREDLGITKQELAVKLGYSYSEYSKALHKVRPFDLNKVTERAEDDAQLAIAEAWAAELRGRLQKDLVADLCGRVSAQVAKVDAQVAKVDRLLDMLGLGPSRQAKADLRDADDARKTA